jgi:cytochrome c551/c552
LWVIGRLKGRGHKIVSSVKFKSMRRSLTNCLKGAGLLAIVAGSFAFTGKPVAANEVYQASGATALKGKALMDKSDCNACHSVDNKIVGPAFKDIAKKYKGDKTAVAKLSEKIIKGGSGNWGEIPMAPHPQISTADAGDMVKYILSLAPATPAKPGAKPAAKKAPAKKA